MPNAKTQRQGPNATYIPLACVWVSRWVKRNFKVSRRVKHEKCASSNAKYTNMLVYFALGNAKFWRRLHCPTPTPNARYFASQWNIGFNVFTCYLSVHSLYITGPILAYIAYIVRE